jgi:cyclophilin family peptidyl-prolyl cis-trans isomerase
MRTSRAVLNVEGLEDRSNPAGLVTAQVFDGVLYLTGDDAANMVSVTNVGDNTVVLTSIDGTTSINGAATLRLGGVKRGYHAVMNGGDDVLMIDRTTGRSGLNIDMGDGNDILMVQRIGHRGDTRLIGGAGNDTIVLQTGEFRKDVLINAGDGDDQVTINAVRGRAGLGLRNTGGSDFVGGQAFAFKRTTNIGFANGTRPATLPPFTSDVPPVDTTAPTVSLTSSTPAAFRAGTADFVATFSEDVTGFSASGVSVTNGSVTAFTPVDARTYRFSVTPLSNGPVTAQVNAGAASDAAGNASTASDAVSRTFDNTTATPTLNLQAASDSGTVGDLRTDRAAVILNGTAEAGSTVRLFAATAGTAPGSGTLLAATTATAAGTFSFSQTLTAGPNSFTVQATDAAGNVSTTFTQTFTLNAAPTATALTRNLTVAGGAQTVDLASGVFADAERVVRFTVSFPDPTTGTAQTASLDVNLFADDAPSTVANFLAYINSADANTNFNGSIFHRLATDFVLQGGGFKFNNTTKSFTTLSKLPAINNEPGTSNTLGTIAFAKTGGNPNSATNEFFFNLADNSSNLDTQNGGFTVFGQVMNGGLATLATLDRLRTFNGSGVPGAPPFPVGPNANTTNFPANITPADLATATTVAELTNAQKLTFSIVSNSNPAAATAALNGSSLSLTPVAGGTTTITVRATDLDGTSTDTTITVNVS